MEDSQKRYHWRDTRLLMAIVILTGLGLLIAAPLFVHELNRFKMLGFPLGFYLTAQGALIGVAVLVFWYSSQQDSIDQRHGLSEDM